MGEAGTFTGQGLHTNWLRSHGGQWVNGKSLWPNNLLNKLLLRPGCTSAAAAVRTGTTNAGFLHGECGLPVMRARDTALPRRANVLYVLAGASAAASPLLKTDKAGSACLERTTVWHHPSAKAVKVPVLFWDRVVHDRAISIALNVFFERLPRLTLIKRTATSGKTRFTMA